MEKNSPAHGNWEPLLKLKTKDATIYLAITESDWYRIAKLLKNGYKDMAMAYFILSVVYVGKDSYPPARKEHHNTDSTGEKATKFEKFLAAEHAAGRRIGYLYCKLPNMSDMFEAMETLTMNALNGLPERAQLTNTRQGNKFNAVVKTESHDPKMQIPILLHFIHNAMAQEIVWSRNYGQLKIDGNGSDQGGSGFGSKVITIDESDVKIVERIDMADEHILGRSGKMDDTTKKLLNSWAPGINNKNSNPYSLRSKRQFGTMSSNYAVIDVDEKTNEVRWLQLKTVLSKKEEAFLLRYYDMELNGAIGIADTMLLIHHDGSAFHMRYKFETLFYCVDGGF